MSSTIGSFSILCAFQDFLRLGEGGPDRSCDEVVLCHDFLYFHLVIVEEAHIAVGYDSDEMPLLVADRHAADLVLAHQLVRLIDIIVRGEEEGVDS